MASIQFNVHVSQHETIDNLTNAWKRDRTPLVVSASGRIDLRPESELLRNRPRGPFVFPP